jgi:TetR/AcrR family transcriptional regulator, transcriptional repressor for nem operon
VHDKTTREHIVEAADRLFYRQGYASTSFAHIADAVHLSRGNFYHHFKTKDEILDAVIGARLADTQNMLDQWDAEAPHPADRIRRFIQILLVNKADIQRYGCPVGTLSNELAKLGHAALPESAMLFTLFRQWLRQQFVRLGRAGDGDALAMHLLVRSQGVATLATAFHDEKFVRREVRLMCDWLDALVQEPTSDA